MESLDTATSIANWFDAFLKHGSIVSVLLSLAFGWSFAIFASFPIHRFVKEDDLATFWARTACVFGSFLITLITWPNDWRLAWALTMGMASPLLGLLVLSIARKWKPELVANVFSMKKTTADPTDEAGA